MNRHRKAFREFKKKLYNELENEVNRIVLFGSVARGEEVSESDVDVLVVLEDRSLKEKVFEVSYDVMLQEDIYISPKVIDKVQFEEMKDSSFVKSIREEMETYA
jgi:predicted nucleotidyltransferase